MSMRTRRASRGAIGLLLSMVIPLACVNATDVQLLRVASSGVLFGQAYLDLDGTGSRTTVDVPISGITVYLVTGPSQDVVLQTATDSAGAFVFGEVPVGSYSLLLDRTTLGDSLQLLSSIDPVTVEFGDTTLVTLGATFPFLTVEEVLAAAPGRLVFTSGIALNQRVNFDPTGQVHFAGASLFLRGLNVDRSGVGPGDSVRLLGRTTSDNGRPALNQVTPFILIPAAALIVPEASSTGLAATADGGRLDAALVRLRDAEFTDTATSPDGSFRFWADDGSDSVEVVMRSFLGVNKSVFRPDTTIRISQIDGLLSPVVDGAGAVRWRLLPRAAGDVTLETKFADIAVTASLDTTRAKLGDTVQVTIVARNLGPRTATGVSVRDTIPTAMSFVSATATTGTYTSSTGIWNIGNRVNGTADTLRLRMRVIDGTPGTVQNTAQSMGLTFEVDPTGSNNGFVVFLTIF